MNQIKSDEFCINNCGDTKMTFKTPDCETFVNSEHKHDYTQCEDLEQDIFVFMGDHSFGTVEKYS